VSSIPLGKLAADDAGRDAIHIAVSPVVAAEALPPGTHVGINKDGKADGNKPHIGIVDPYLMQAVEPGERFYLCLYPNTITSLRHHWVHPAFKDEGPPSKEVFDKSASEAWLRDYANRFKTYTKDPEDAYQCLLGELREQYICYEGIDMHGFSELKDADELRKHAQIVLGIQIKWEEFTFTCNC
jgi:hypothetical protein